MFNISTHSNDVAFNLVESMTSSRLTVEIFIVVSDIHLNGVFEYFTISFYILEKCERVASDVELYFNLLLINRFRIS